MPTIAPDALAGRTVLVTGAQQGIGAAIALAAAEAGADVAVNYLDDLDAARGVVAAIKTRGRRAVLVQADLGQVEWARRAVAENAGQSLPLGRIGQPPEIAAVAVFLASDGASFKSFMTGETVHVNGGAYMT